MLFGRNLFWNDKCDCAFVEGVVVRILQFKKHLVRAGGKTHQDDWVTTRICPHPRGIVESHMKVSDARRDRQSIGAEHRRNVQVLCTIYWIIATPREASGPASGGSITIFAGGSLPVSGITGAGRQMSVAFCAIAVIAYNTMAATDSRAVPFELVFMFCPPFPSISGSGLVSN